MQRLSLESTKPSVTSAEAAFDAFKAFFTPKPLKKDPAEKVDLEASEASTPGDGEERTPGRLQAVWPPLKEEKVGLKYTEAEHQAALLQLKRECKEELEKLQEDFGLELSRLRVENQDSCRPSGRAADQTLPDRETFVKTPEDGDGTGRSCTSPQQQKVTPKKLDLASISLSLSAIKWPSTSTSTSTSSSSSFHTRLSSSTTSSSLSGALTVDKPPRKPAVEPSRPMRPLYWTRIQIQDNNNNNTLWNVLEEPDIINTSEFEDLFAKTTTQTKKKPLSEAYEKKAKARKIVKLLDGKRSQAVGILISSLHLEMKDIQQAILTVNHSVVDVETIEALYENRAQPEELEKIKKHYEMSAEEDVKLLDKPEQFLYELSQIPNFSDRAHCVIFQSAFVDGIASVQRKLKTVSSVCEALLESDGVRRVVGLVLALGNHMNGGSRVRGQADGFGLEILPKLKDVKSRDNRISLVDYVVSYYLHNVDKNAGTDKSVFPLPEPQDAFLAAQVKFDDLNRDLRQLGRDLTRCEKDLQKVCSDSPEEHLQPFKDKMEAFVLSARKEHAEASYQLMTVQKSFQDLSLYFGLKPKTGEKDVTAGHFFMLWFEFCADFKTRWKRENKNISKERLKEAQLSVKRITAEKKVETRKINPNSLKERLRQKEANMSSL
ncbi:Formin [Larimichthys crocea]|uniref:Uncharacterized protein n=1 Tax=Larimichthys crocea TaxID=215358 RepID=A0ACD3QXV2_LARCR|nr:Formin [Larimichthys crocea]